jgi:hypothetical protein
METVNISRYLSCKYQFDSLGLEDVFYNSKLTYSIRQLSVLDGYSTELIVEAFQKSLRVCYLLGINSNHHFKKVYVYDTKMGVLQIDWLMSRNGFNLMVMQMPSLNEKMARWLWALSNS